MTRSVFLFRAVTILAAAFVATIGFAQTPPGQAVSGSIASLGTGGFTLTAQDGSSVQIVYDAKLRITERVTASIADITKGVFMGVTSQRESDGGLKAISITIFPTEFAQAIGGREFVMNDGNTMTNATLAQEVEGVDGTTLTMAYQGGSSEIRLDPDVPIYKLTLLAPTDLKVGEAVSVRGSKDASGAVDAMGIAVM